MKMTVGELIEQLKGFDPATPVVVPDPGADADAWEAGICWTDISQVVLKPTLVYRPRYEIRCDRTDYITGADAWTEVPAVRLACEYMEDL